MSILPPLGKISADAHTAHWLRNGPFFQALFPQNSLDEFWRSAYKSYSMIGVKAIKIILPFASSWVCQYGFSALTEIKSKKRETSWNWWLNAGVVGKNGTSFLSLFVPENRHTHRINFFKATLFCSNCAANFLYILSAPQAEKVWESLS